MFTYDHGSLVTLRHMWPIETIFPLFFIKVLMRSYWLI